MRWWKYGIATKTVTMTIHQTIISIVHHRKQEMMENIISGPFFPVPYKAGATLTRPAHIHMRISETTMQDLVTQVYFKGDKHIAEDMSSSDPRSLHRILDISHE